MKHHRITISGEKGRYNATGAVTLSASASPMLDAAKSLLKHGAAPDDTLGGHCADLTIAPVSLASITRPRKPPLMRAWEARNDVAA